MTQRRALITGITDQNGSYLTEFLLTEGYEVPRVAHVQIVERDQTIHDLTRPNAELRARVDAIPNTPAQEAVEASRRVRRIVLRRSR